VPASLDPLEDARAADEAGSFEHGQLGSGNDGSPVVGAERSNRRNTFLAWR
jgi:hypothetical protein